MHFIILNMYMNSNRIAWLAYSSRVWHIVKSSPGQIKPNTYKIGICCFYAKQEE